MSPYFAAEARRQGLERMIKDAANAVKAPATIKVGGMSDGLLPSDCLTFHAFLLRE